VARARSPDLSRALQACDFALAVWDPENATVRLVNDAVAQLVGVPMNRLIGHRVDELFLPRTAVDSARAALLSGAVDEAKSRRQLLRPDGPAVDVTLWTRTVDVDGHRAGITLVVPDTDIPRLGRDPAQPWRDLTPIAIGTMVPDWRISCVSTEMAEILGPAPGGWRGESLLGLVHTADQGLVPQYQRAEAAPSATCALRFRRRDGAWVDLCLLTAPTAEDKYPGTVAFALVGPPRASLSDRVEELELRLRRIGSEVRAAGVLDTVQGLPAPSEFPQLAELTTRQWEILSRLLRGERVPGIARALYVSPSTVRNHLSSIFAKFGVHSQAELIELLRTETSGKPE
jgi:DNA-binding CsgD family transcriptional regulator/PAS domain-containing protein